MFLRGDTWLMVIPSDKDEGCLVANVVNDDACKECKILTSSDFSFLFS